jgi:predicted PurR-regulated permease PerM
MLTIIFTALLSSIFTALAFLYIFNSVIKPYLSTQITLIRAEAETTISQASPQISKDIADAIEAKIAEIQPELEVHVKQELDQIIDEFLPQLSKEVEDGVDNAFKKFIPTVMGSAATMPAETILKTSSTLLSTGIDILRSVTPDVKK